MSPAMIFQLQLVLGYVPWLLCFGAYAWTRYAPNTHDILAHREPVLPKQRTEVQGRWGFTPQWGLATAVLAFVSLLSLTKVSEFLYFQF